MHAKRAIRSPPFALCLSRREGRGLSRDSNAAFRFRVEARPKGVHTHAASRTGSDLTVVPLSFAPFASRCLAPGSAAALACLAPKPLNIWLNWRTLILRCCGWNSGLPQAVRSRQMGVTIESGRDNLDSNAAEPAGALSYLPIARVRQSHPLVSARHISECKAKVNSEPVSSRTRAKYPSVQQLPFF